MSESNYRNLDVWKLGRALAKDVYQETQTFPREEIFGLTQQMRRSAVSILSNFAEGQGRWSRADYRHFLYIARGSALEVDAQCVIACDVGYLAADAAERLCETATRIAQMLNGMIRRTRAAP